MRNRTRIIGLTVLLPAVFALTPAVAAPGVLAGNPWHNVAPAASTDGNPWHGVAPAAAGNPWIGAAPQDRDL